MFPPLKVTFDSGEEFVLEPKPRDMALAERDYQTDYASSKPFRSAYATALATLSRLHRAGELNGLVVPESIDALMDVADVEVITEEAEGKAPDPAPTTGS